MKIKSALGLFLAAAAVPATVFAASVYVKSAKAKILQSPRFDAPLVAEAGRGQELDLLKKSERWLNVALGADKGWVPELLVSEEPPKERQSLLETGGEDLTGKSRRRASAIATAGASRGLTEEGIRELTAREGNKGDWRSLAKLEATVIDPGEAARFVSAVRGQGQEGRK